MKIFAYNPEVDELEKTFLSSATAAGATTFKVKNSNRFIDGRKVLVGEMSRERSEILLLSSHTNIQLTLAAAEFPHDTDDPIYALEYDKIRIYRSTTGVNGTYNLLDTIDIDVDNENGQTVYEDPNALDTYYYKISHYDSISILESEKSAAIQSTGYPDGTVGRSILNVAGEIGDPDFMTFTIDNWLAIMQDINKDLLTQAKRPYRFLKKAQNLDALTGLSYVAFPTDLWKIDYVEVNDAQPSSTSTHHAKLVSATDMRYRRSQTLLPGDFVDEIAYDDEANRLLYNPAARVDRIGAFTLHYYKMFDQITNMSNTLETPTDLVYTLGMKRRWYLRKMDDDSKYRLQFSEYDKAYQAEIVKLQREKNIVAGAPTGMKPDHKVYSQFGGRRYRQ